MGGAPTGKWDTIPEHLRGEDQPYDIRQAEAKLKVRRPGVPEVTIPLEKTAFIIGRSPNEVDLVLDDEMVSKKHAKLTMDARGYFRLEDLGSQNKIRFKNRPVRRLNLVDGDVFSIGRTEFTFVAKMNRFPKGASPPSPAPRLDSVVEPPEPKPQPKDLAVPSLEMPKDPAEALGESEES
jgi:pSer/pThr/pTyr-binding forkhead associated (FHA) protein